MRTIDRDQIVTCRCGGLEGSASYEVDGRFLVLTSTLGAVKTVVGLQDPRRLAMKTLKNLCHEAAGRQACDRFSGSLS